MSTEETHIANLNMYCRRSVSHYYKSYWNNSSSRM